MFHVLSVDSIGLNKRVPPCNPSMSSVVEVSDAGFGPDSKLGDVRKLAFEWVRGGGVTDNLGEFEFSGTNLGTTPPMGDFESDSGSRCSRTN